MTWFQTLPPPVKITLFACIAAGVDLLLTPTVLGDAPWYSEFSQADNRTRTQEQDVFTQPVNLAGRWPKECSRTMGLIHTERDARGEANEDAKILL